MKQDYIKLEDCEKGYIYKISSRNLRLGVYDGNQGFIGIREKFDTLYLFTEFHYDQGPPYGTVFPMTKLTPLTEGIQLRESLDTVDEVTGRKVEFDFPIPQGGRGWYFADTGESDREIKPVSPTNKDLFSHLLQIEHSLGLRQHPRT
jgi:hypothetical protein